MIHYSTVLVKQTVFGRQSPLPILEYRIIT